MTTIHPLMKFHVARTCAVNPPDVALSLTRTQVWEALKTRLRTHRKSSIRDLEVVEEHDSGLTRTYHRKGIGGKMREVITFDNDVKVRTHSFESLYPRLTST